MIGPRLILLLHSTSKSRSPLKVEVISVKESIFCRQNFNFVWDHHVGASMKWFEWTIAFDENSSYNDHLLLTQSTQLVPPRPALYTDWLCFIKIGTILSSLEEATTWTAHRLHVDVSPSIDPPTTRSFLIPSEWHCEQRPLLPFLSIPSRRLNVKNCVWLPCSEWWDLL